MTGSASRQIALGPSWLDPDVLIEAFGMLGVLAIVFVESGLLVGFLLPGDSLLFTAGLLSSTGTLPALWVLLVTIPLAAIAGDQVGYAIGRKAGPAVFNRPDSRFFQHENVERAQEFFDRYGPRTIVLARFVPIVRTFAPVTAGVARMEYRTFLLYNVVGGVLWGVSVTTLGYFLGQVDWVHANIELVLIAIVGTSFIPMAAELLRAARSRRSRLARFRAVAIAVYEKPTCTTCRQLAELLAERGIDFDAVEYHVLGLTEEEIRGLIAKTGIPAADLLRLREDGARDLADSGDEDVIVAAMVERPELLQRPIVVNGDRAVLARPIERALEIL